MQTRVPTIVASTGCAGTPPLLVRAGSLGNQPSRTVDDADRFSFDELMVSACKLCTSDWTVKLVDVGDGVARAKMPNGNRKAMNGFYVGG